MLADERIWQLLPLVVDKKLGAQFREANRARQKRKVQDRVIEILSKERPDWLSGQVDTIDLHEVESVLKMVSSQSLSVSEFKFAHNFICLSLAKGNHLKIWRAEVPALIQTFINERAFRSESAFRRINTFRQFKLDYLAQLEQGNQAASLDDLTSFAISIVLFSGVFEVSILQALPKAVSGNKVIQLEQYHWLDVYYDDKSKAASYSKSESSKTLKRIFLEPISMLLLLNLWRDETRFDEADSLTVKQMLQAVNSISETVKFSKLEQFLETAALVYELDNPDIPAFMAATTSGQLETHSLPEHVISRLTNTAPTYQLPETSINEGLPLRTLKKMGVSTSVTTKTDKLGLAKIRQCLKSGDAKKLTKQEAIQRLELFTTNRPFEYSLAVRLLAEWALSLIQFGTRFKTNIKPQSVYSYITIIGSWITDFAGDVDLYSFDEYEWHAWFSRIIEANNYRKGRSLNAFTGRMQEFSSFLHRQYNIPYFDTGVNSAADKRVVRADYLHNGEFSFITQALGERGELGYILQTLFILAYRTGLRKHELIQLKLTDIFWHEQVLLTVRCNEYGGLKSQSAYRTLPLHLLLLPNELQRFSEYFQTRKSLLNQQHGLVFSNILTGNKPLQPDVIDSQITGIIKAVAGSQASFHTIRHSAINNWYIQLFIKQKDWPFDKQTYPLGQVTLGHLVGESNAKSGKALYAIAQLAGHLSPKITLLNYCHFLDWHQIISSKKQPEIPVSWVAACLHIKASTLRHYQRQTGMSWRALFMAKILAATPKERQTLYESTQGVQQQAPLRPVLLSTGQVMAYASLLSEYDRGATVEELALRFQLDLIVVEIIVEVARELANIKTKKRASRLIHASRQSRLQKEKLKIAPGRLQSQAHIEDVDNILTNLRVLMKEDRVKALWFIDFYIERVLTSKPGIQIKNANEYADYTGVVSKLVDDKRIFWKVKLGKLPLEEVKRQFAPEGTAQPNQIELEDYVLERSTLGHVRVCVQSTIESKSDSIQSNINAYSLTYAIHLAKLALEVQKRIKEGS